MGWGQVGRWRAHPRFRPSRRIQPARQPDAACGYPPRGIRVAIGARAVNSCPIPVTFAIAAVERCAFRSGAEPKVPLRSRSRFSPLVISAPSAFGTFSYLRRRRTLPPRWKYRAPGSPPVASDALAGGRPRGQISARVAPPRLGGLRSWRTGGRLFFGAASDHAEGPLTTLASPAVSPDAGRQFGRRSLGTCPLSMGHAVHRKTGIADYLRPGQTSVDVVSPVDAASNPPRASSRMGHFPMCTAAAVGTKVTVVRILGNHCEPEGNRGEPLSACPNADYGSTPEQMPTCHSSPPARGRPA